MAKGRNLCWIEDHAALLRDAAGLEEVRHNIAAGDIYIVRRQFDPGLIQEIRFWFRPIFAVLQLIPEEHQSLHRLIGQNHQSVECDETPYAQFAVHHFYGAHTDK